MIIELILAGTLELAPGYYENVEKARYLQDIVNYAIDEENFIMACEGQKLVTMYMYQAGKPIHQGMIDESHKLADHLCTIAEDAKL